MVSGLWLVVWSEPLASDDPGGAIRQTTNPQITGGRLAERTVLSFHGQTMSEWQVRANQRRDFRAVKAPEVEPPKPVRGKKDRKRWCGGHEGREHKLECRPYKGWLGAEKGWREHVCTVCGKQVDWYSPWSQWGPDSKNKKPAWVTS